MLILALRLNAIDCNVDTSVVVILRVDAALIEL